MVFEDGRFPKSKEILQESHIKIGPKRVCKIEAKVSQKGAKVGARNRQYFEKIPEKGRAKIDAKKGRRNNPKNQDSIKCWDDRVRKAGRRGRDLGRGSVGSFLVLGWFSNCLTRPAARWVRRMLFCTKWRHGAPRFDFSFHF